MKIFVCGSLKNVEKNPEMCERFVEKLGKIIMERNHILLSGCSGSLDKKIAESAAFWLENNEKKANNQIRSYILDGEEDKQVHDVGDIIISEFKDWSLKHSKLNIPEQIAKADVAIIISGSEGTNIAANFARIAEKPILGIGMFGGSGYQNHREYKKVFKKKYAHFLSDKRSYEDLKQYTSNPTQLAENIVSFCEDLRFSNNVFCIMSFKKEYNNVFSIFKSACDQVGFHAVRTDHDPELTPIIKKILKGIKQSNFVIADVSEMSSNVFYEIGYARGIGKPVIITAKNDTVLPFDVKDLPVIFYDPQNLNENLESKLETKIRNQKIKVY